MPLTEKDQKRKRRRRKLKKLKTKLSEAEHLETRQNLMRKIRKLEPLFEPAGWCPVDHSLRRPRQFIDGVLQDQRRIAEGLALIRRKVCLDNALHPSLRYDAWHTQADVAQTILAFQGD